MCGRFALITPSESLRQLLDFTNRPNLRPRYNIAPGQAITIIRQNAAMRECVQAYWGLIPQWVKPQPVWDHGTQTTSQKPRKKYGPQHNAMGESVHEKPYFKNAYRYRRCLVPADAFYEWQTHKTGSGSQSGRQPYCVRRCDQEPFVMAGIWEQSTDADGQDIESCAIITTRANASLSPIHSRMPVILKSEHWDRWLTTAPQKADRLRELLTPAPEEDFSAYPISTAVNRVAHDHHKLWQQVTPKPVT